MSDTPIKIGYCLSLPVSYASGELVVPYRAAVAAR
jgi:hypothetical protein